MLTTIHASLGLTTRSAVANEQSILNSAYIFVMRLFKLILLFFKIDTKLSCSDLLMKPPIPADRLAFFQGRLMGISVPRVCHMR